MLQLSSPQLDIGKCLVQFIKTKHNVSRRMVIAVWLEIMSFYFIKDTGFFLTATTARPDIEKPLTIEDHESFSFYPRVEKILWVTHTENLGQ